MRENKVVVAWLLLMLLAVVWGMSFLMIKKVVGIIEPLQLGAARVLIAGLALSPWLFIKAKKHTKKEFNYMFLSGLFGYLIPSVAFAIVGKHLNSSLSGTLNSSTPLFTLIIGALFFSQKIKNLQILGIAFGFAGSLLLVLTGNDGNLNFDNPYALLAIMATILYGINVNIIGTHLKNVSPIKISAFSLAGVAVLALVYLLNTDFFTVILRPENRNQLVYLFILGAINTGVATVIFNYVLQITSPVFGSSVTYLIPVVATIAGFLDDELISIWHFLGMIIIFVGIYLLNKKSKNLPLPLTKSS